MPGRVEREAVKNIYGDRALSRDVLGRNGDIVGRRRQQRGIRSHLHEHVTHHRAATVVAQFVAQRKRLLGVRRLDDQIAAIDNLGGDTVRHVDELLRNLDRRALRVRVVGEQVYLGNSPRSDGDVVRNGCRLLQLVWLRDDRDFDLANPGRTERVVNLVTEDIRPGRGRRRFVDEVVGSALSHRPEARIAGKVEQLGRVTVRVDTVEGDIDPNVAARQNSGDQRGRFRVLIVCSIQTGDRENGRSRCCLPERVQHTVVDAVLARRGRRLEAQLIFAYEREPPRRRCHQVFVEEHRSVIGVKIVIQHINRDDVTDPHLRRVVQRNRWLVLGQRGYWNNRDAGRGRTYAVRDCVAEVHLLGKCGRRGNAYERALEQLDDKSLQRVLVRHVNRLHGQDASARAYVVRQNGYRGRLFAAQVRGVFDGNGWQICVGRFFPHVDAHQSDARVGPGCQRVFEVEDASVRRAERDGASVGIE